MRRIVAMLAVALLTGRDSPTPRAGAAGHGFQHQPERDSFGDADGQTGQVFKRPKRLRPYRRHPHGRLGRHGVRGRRRRRHGRRRRRHGRRQGRSKVSRRDVCQKMLPSRLKLR